jgi:hypothetical protein
LQERFSYPATFLFPTEPYRRFEYKIAAMTRSAEATTANGTA